MKTFLISGGAGFIGSHLCDRFIKEGHKVIAVDNFYTGSAQNIAHLKNNPLFNFIEADINKPLNIDEKTDFILNFACPASPPKYQKDPVFTLNTCYVGLVNMLEIARRDNAVILQASTSEVYGDPSMHPQKEDYRGNVNPHGIRSCYDEGKRIGETLMFDYFRKYGVRIKVIRIFNTYGPRMEKDDGRVISNFIVQALTNTPITIYGDGAQTRSLCYIDDLIDGIYAMLFSDENFRGPVNLGTDFEVTVKEIAQRIISLTNSKSEIVQKPLPEDDPMRRCADLGLASKRLGYRPKVSIQAGLLKTIEYFKPLI